MSFPVVVEAIFWCSCFLSILLNLTLASSDSRFPIYAVVWGSISIPHNDGCYFDLANGWRSGTPLKQHICGCRSGTPRKVLVYIYIYIHKCVAMIVLIVFLCFVSLFLWFLLFFFGRPSRHPNANCQWLVLGNLHRLSRFSIGFEAFNWIESVGCSSSGYQEKKRLARMLGYKTSLKDGKITITKESQCLGNFKRLNELEYCDAQMLNVWNIYLHLAQTYGKCR